MTEEPQRRHHVVIAGGGFGGLFAARKPDNSRFNLTLLDKRCFHTFQPLLSSVAVGMLTTGDVCTPPRMTLRHRKNVPTLMSTTYDIDPGTRALCHQAAELTSEDAERAPWLSFVVVGAGPGPGSNGPAPSPRAHRSWSTIFAGQAPRRGQDHAGLRLQGSGQHGRDGPLSRGRQPAVVHSGGAQRLAAVGAGHIYALIGSEHRLRVMLRRIWKYCTRRSGDRLITGRPPDTRRIRQ